MYLRIPVAFFLLRNPPHFFLLYDKCRYEKRHARTRGDVTDSDRERGGERVDKGFVDEARMGPDSLETARTAMIGERAMDVWDKRRRGDKECFHLNARP